MKVKIIRTRIIWSSALVALFLGACEDFVKVGLPEDRITSGNVFKDDESARSAMVGLYIAMSEEPQFNNSAISLSTALSSDELKTTHADQLEFQENEINAENAFVKSNLWKPGYRFIYLANSILNGIVNSKDRIDPELSEQLEGEARFIRAMCYFYLVNLFGDIPLITGVDLLENSTQKKSSSQLVYKFILDELVKAKDLLPADFDYSNESQQRIRPTTWAASALLSKVYLYEGSWDKASIEASRVIDQSERFRLVNIDSVFLSGSSEAIWQLQPVIPGLGTWEATLYITENAEPGYSITHELLSDFESGDARKSHWLDSVGSGENIYYFAHKYRSLSTPTEYHVEIRLAEVLLIRAEARYQLNELKSGMDDVNSVRLRAMLLPIPSNSITPELLFNAIQQERRVELFTEGNRWFDIKRWGKATDLVSLSYKKWEDTDLLYPLPFSEILLNKNLEPQNSGY